MLEVSGLVRRFSGYTAVDGVNLAVAEEESRAVIGSNGAGKSTLFNMVSGGLRPSAGRIRFAGADVTGLPPYRLARRGVGRTFQINNVFGGQSVAGNIRIALIARHRRQWNLYASAVTLYEREIEDLADLVGLSSLRGRAVETLSYGDRRRLEIAIMLAGEPSLLLLDEPTCGMALPDRLPLVDMIKRIVRQRRMTAVIIEHDMDIVFTLADRITVMHRGRVIAEDEPDRIMAHPEVRDVLSGNVTDAGTRRQGPHDRAG